MSVMCLDNSRNLIKNERMSLIALFTDNLYPSSGSKKQTIYYIYVSASIHEYLILISCDLVKFGHFTLQLLILSPDHGGISRNSGVGITYFLCIL